MTQRVIYQHRALSGPRGARAPVRSPWHVKVGLSAGSIVEFESNSTKRTKKKPTFTLIITPIILLPPPQFRLLWQDSIVSSLLCQLVNNSCALRTYEIDMNTPRACESSAFLSELAAPHQPRAERHVNILPRIVLLHLGSGLPSPAPIRLVEHSVRPRIVPLNRRPECFFREICWKFQRLLILFLTRTESRLSWRQHHV